MFDVKKKVYVTTLNKTNLTFNQQINPQLKNNRVNKNENKKEKET